MAKRHYVVTLVPGTDPKQAATDLRSRGFAVDNVMDEIGIISGTAEESAVPTVQATGGVLDVSESGEVQLPPGESEVQ